MKVSEISTPAKMITSMLELGTEKKPHPPWKHSWKSIKGQRTKNSQAVNANASPATESLHNPRLLRYPQ